MIDYKSQYFTIEALEDGLTAKLSYNVCEYRVDNGEWISLAANTETVAINTGQTMSFKIENPTIVSSFGMGTFTINKKCNIKGNIMSLLYGDDFEGQTDYSAMTSAFQQLFYRCTNLISAKDLILPDAVASDCYRNMFYGCTGLTSAPELPATTLAYFCYAYMFSGCTGLTSVPELPATTLANSCYYGMFSSCTGLTSAPELPVTTLAGSCYASMFSGCTGLTSVPNELPATTLAEHCYNSMFSGCTGLTSVPELPATTLADSCYRNMFYGCTGLTSAPELPATTLANYCYYYMFRDCTGLTSVPNELPATTLADNCYYYMFRDCTGLTSVPNELPATTLANSCYYGMFYGCTKLTSAPELPAATLTTSCYSNMFKNCKKLNYIKMLATDINASSCLNSWVYRVSSTGTFVKSPEMTTLPTGSSGIPTGWDVKTPEIDYSKEYFTIEALEDGLTAKLLHNACEYRVDDGEWISLSANTETAAINTGQTLQFKTNNFKPETSDTTSEFVITKQCNISGNIMSLLYGDNFEGQTDLTGKNSVLNKLFADCNKILNAKNLILSATTLAERCYHYMFRGCTKLTSAPELPATTLANYCYQEMFSGCTGLTSAPELPATTLANYCYFDMFRDCTGLASAPELPATTLANSCYYGMFYGCTSLTSAPELPATTLADSCYRNMFYGCTGLTSAPELPATTLANYCYFDMFRDCTGLASAPELPATTLADSCYRNMFYGCTKLTSAPELPATTLADSCYQEMFSGCTSLTSAPELPAATLTTSCYSNMFRDCSNLNYIKMLATDINANYCLNNWVSGVSKTGTFVKSPEMTTLTVGVSGIPTGWVVKNISPTITNSANTSVTFNYNDGLFSPTSEAIELTEYFSQDELLSCQPMCDIVVNINDNTEHTLISDYIWTNDKTLNDVLTENNISVGVYNINIDITQVYAPEDTGYYYYTLDEVDPFVEKDWLRILPLNYGDTTISLSKDIKYSINGSDWIKLYAGNTITVTRDDVVYFKGTELQNSFNISSSFNVEGNIMSLIYADDFEGQTDLTGKDSAFSGLFKDCTTISNAKNLILPATTLANSCYYGMFYGCTKLTSAPELPATTLANYCYQEMFSGCTGLTSAPELPATTLANSCYQNMFRGCSNLNYIKMLATDINASYCLYYWVDGVSESGTFIKSPEMTTLTVGVSGIPIGWEVEDYNKNNDSPSNPGWPSWPSQSNKKFLDETGLNTVWGLIKTNFFDRNTGLDTPLYFRYRDNKNTEWIFKYNGIELIYAPYDEGDETYMSLLSEIEEIGYDIIDLTSGVYYATTSSTASKVSNPLTVKNASGDILVEYDGGQPEVEITLPGITEITYSDLKNLRDNYLLSIGEKYRIIDYITTTNGNEGSTSAGHAFDIIVEALDKNVLSETVSVCQAKYFNKNAEIPETPSNGTWYSYVNIIPENWVTPEESEIVDEMKNAVSFDPTTENIRKVCLAKGESFELNCESGYICVKFEWNGGEGSSKKINMCGVTLKNAETGEIVSHDYHYGYTGHNKDKNKYILYAPTSGNYYIDCFIIRHSDYDGGVIDSNVVISAYPIDNDNYFQNSKLTSWLVKYSLDNDTSRFRWAKSDGKGVIYYLKDEYDNQAGFDFKNILFDGKYVFNYLIDDTNYDGSVNYGRQCYSNTIGLDLTDVGTGSLTGLPYVYFNNTSNVSECHSNIVGKNCWKIKFGNYCCNNTINSECEEITFGNDCSYNTLGHFCTKLTFSELCSYNTFGAHCTNNTFGSDCNYNTFKDYCSDNTFAAECYNNIFGFECSFNNFGEDCNNNIFGYSCNNNVFGNSCNYNKASDTFIENQLDETCSYNIFGNEFRNNVFGTNCLYNVFGSDCKQNKLGYNCSYNNFGNSCMYNILGCDGNWEYSNSEGRCVSNTFKNNCVLLKLQDSCSYNTFGNNCGIKQEVENGKLTYESIGNEFGRNCLNNVFDSYCAGNSFGLSCESNIFGDHCTDNTFGNNCCYNIYNHYCKNISCGQYCQSNNFDQYCTNHELGDYYIRCHYGKKTNNCKITDSENNLINYCKLISFGDECGVSSGLRLYSDNFGNGSTSSYVQLITVKPLISSSGIEITQKSENEVIRDRNFTTIIGKTSNNTIIQNENYENGTLTLVLF